MKAFLVIFVLVVIGGMAYLWNYQSTPIPTKGVIYYYGEECPHCHEVQAFLEENHIADKVTFEKKEVWHNSSNAREMQKVSKQCQVKQEGVPFLFVDGKCFVGTPDVIAQFKKLAGME